MCAHVAIRLTKKCLIRPMCQAADIIFCVITTTLFAPWKDKLQDAAVCNREFLSERGSVGLVYKACMWCARN